MKKIKIFLKFALKNRLFGKINWKKSKFFVCEIAWKYRNFSEIFLENRNFLTWIHDPQISNQIDDAAMIIWIDAYFIFPLQIIEYLGVYKVLLNRIKAEYESCISTIRDGQHEAFFLSGKLNEVANAPTALLNYKKRTEDLENK